MTLFPPALKKGDTIGVFAPSSYVEEADIEKSKAVIEEHGFNVFVHPQTYERENQSAGNHLQKSLAFQGLWQREDIKAIWAAGGGNRCLHLVETINFDKLAKNPKILIGFSDVTALLNAVYAYTDIATIHAPVFKQLHQYDHVQLHHLLHILMGAKVSYTVEAENVLHHGEAQGELIGGNLSLFQLMPSLLPDEVLEDSILFLEDCNEELSRLDRAFAYLKQLGVLSKIKGLILGEFTDLKDSGRPFGYTFDDVIHEHTEALDIPILKDMPFGHDQNNYAMPIGFNASIDTEKKEFTLLDSLVS